MRRFSPREVAAMGQDAEVRVLPRPIRDQTEVARMLGITPGMVHYHEAAALRKIAAAIAACTSMRVRDGRAAARALIRSYSAAECRRKETA